MMNLASISRYNHEHCLTLLVVVIIIKNFLSAVPVVEAVVNLQLFLSGTSEAG